MITGILGELCEIKVGRTPARADPSFWGVGHRWLSIADMNQGLAIAETKEQITDAGARGGSLIKPGTVLLSFKLSIGKVGIAEVPLYTNEAIAALPMRDDTVLDPRYLMRALQAMDLPASANRAAMGVTLNKRSLSQVRIPLVGLPSQRRIAAILDDADALRTKRRMVVAHLDALVQATFIEMFSASDSIATEASTLMPHMRNGLSPSTSGTYPARVLTLSAVTQGLFTPNAAKQGVFAVEPPADKRVRAGDFLMCRGNGNKNLVGRGTYSRENLPDLVFPDTVVAGTVDSAVATMQFLEVAWRQPAVRSQIEAMARTTNGTYKVNQQSLSGIMVNIPAMALQKLYGAKVDRIRSQREICTRSAAEADHLFASLQAAAFRGEL